MKVLDCTLRDGGYYNNWAFHPDVLEQYLINLNELPIRYAEIGYRSLLKNESLGECFHVTTEFLDKAATLMPNVKKAIMIDEKNTPGSALYNLLSPCKGYIDMIRVTVSVGRIHQGILLLQEIKRLGFETSLNLMYATKWEHDLSFLNLLADASQFLDYFYIVDSYGSMEPDSVKDLVTALRSKIMIPLGFHGHNNMELALINSITAKDAGCEMVDSTLLGMGRGAGNLKTELLLVYLSKKMKLNLNFECLSKCVENFGELQNEYGWGTNLAYMFSGRNEIHQSEVMKEIKKSKKPIGMLLEYLISLVSLHGETSVKPLKHIIN